MEDEVELSLELSIGGCYGKSNRRKNIDGKLRNQCAESPSRSEFPYGKYDAVFGGEYRSKFVDMLAERARQAPRRRADRDARELDGNSEEFARKNTSIFTENTQMQTQIMSPSSQYIPIGMFCSARNGNGDRNVSRNSSIVCGSSRSSSSLFSDHRSSSLKTTGEEIDDKLCVGIGGSSSETESLSNSSDANQSRCVDPCSMTQNGGSVQHMPRVSARGNDPNGKAITGLLYKYTKSEVCIMCACHGASFSPAEFFQHAGGTNISDPLKHITILPSR